MLFVVGKHDVDAAGKTRQQVVGVESTAKVWCLRRLEGQNGGMGRGHKSSGNAAYQQHASDVVIKAHGGYGRLRGIVGYDLCRRGYGRGYVWGYEWSYGWGYGVTEDSNLLNRYPTLYRYYAGE